MHWSEKEANERNLSKLCAQALGWANDRDSKNVENCLMEAFTPENLRISMLRNEKARIIKELRDALSKNSSPEALRHFDAVVERLNMSTRSIPGYQAQYRDL